MCDWDRNSRKSVLEKMNVDCRALNRKDFACRHVGSGQHGGLNTSVSGDGGLREASLRRDRLAQPQN